MIDFFQETLKADLDSFTGDTESVFALKEWVRFLSGKEDREELSQ